MINTQEYIKFIKDKINIKYQQDTVGILMPCYNHGKFLESTLNSIILQDYSKKIIIIIDDKSTDNSLETILSFLDIKKQTINDNHDNVIYVGEIKTIPTIVISLPHNQKQAMARNWGILISYHLCDFYSQLDCDDEYLPNKLSKCMDVAKTDRENIGIVYHDVIIENAMNGVITHEFREPFSYERLMQECIVCNTMLINKLALEEAGLYDKDIAPTEDWDLQLRICERFMAVHIPEPLSLYRVTDQSCTFTVDKQRWQWCWNRIREKLSSKYA